MSSDFSPSQHIGEIMAKAYRRANCILKCFASRDDLYVCAFVVYVRPILEYNGVVSLAEAGHRPKGKGTETFHKKISRNERFKLYDERMH